MKHKFGVKLRDKYAKSEIHYKSLFNLKSLLAKAI
jgi:hypothetical protein